MQPPPYIALLGYGEAGSVFGRDLLALGARVRVHDPRVRPRDAVEVAADEADAVRGVDLVLSVNSASAALGALEAGAQRKLLRSVFFKGMAAAVVEALDAARAAGCEEWLRENIAAELAAAGAGTVDRLVTGTRRHAVRRADEMAAAEDMVRGLGVEPAVARAARDLLLRIRAEEASGPAAGRDTGEAAGPAEGGPRR